LPTNPNKPATDAAAFNSPTILLDRAPVRILRLKAVLDMVGLRRAALYRMKRMGFSRSQSSSVHVPSDGLRKTFRHGLRDGPIGVRSIWGEKPASAPRRVPRAHQDDAPGPPLPQPMNSSGACEPSQGG
jgi:hypothetical protein